jgi:MoaA/NifB/PqqE/SkfB family radical SAM enzyme
MLCPTGHKEQPKKIMTLDLAKKCFSKAVREFRADSLFMGNWGEPLLHPQIYELIDTAKDHGFKEVTIATSFSVNCNVEKLAQSKLNRLHISLSGITAKTYNKVHRYGNIDLVKSNIDKFYKLSKKPIKVFIRWHKYKHNEHEFEAIQALCKRYNIRLDSYFGHLGGVDMLLDWTTGAMNNELTNFINNFVFTDYIRNACARRENKDICIQNSYLIIDPGGDLLHCCVLYDSHKFSIDFLNTAKKDIIRFKEKKNKYCHKCISSGFCGYMQSPKR